jgi:hypothetical protein
MKISSLMFLSSLVVASTDAANGGFRAFVNKMSHKSNNDANDANAAASDEAVDKAPSNEQDERELAHPTSTGCWNDANNVAKWHPQYSQGWAAGYCRLTQDCNSPGYSSELACCKGAYAGQTSGNCLRQLPSPPTTSPTKSGGLDVYYPQYDIPWSDAFCTNAGPMPNGRPTYTTMLACCKGAYAGQMSGKCLASLPSPPTGSPTNSAHTGDFWYPDYDTQWSDAGCSNKLPLPYNNKNDRPSYRTQLACCKGAYGGQTSGTCIAQLPSPPTTTPTGSGGYPFYYPDYDMSWSDAVCKNERPLPFTTGGRPTYSSMLACCKGAYAGQSSGACLASLPNPPTQTPTSAGGLKVWYPDYTTWSGGKCINERPLPSGRLSFSTKKSCCAASYGDQNSHVCMCDVDPCYVCDCPGVVHATTCTAAQVTACIPPTPQPTPPPVP